MYFTLLCKGPSTSSCWVLFYSHFLPSMQILQRGGSFGAAPVYLFAGFCCILWKWQCSSAIENNSSAPKTNELIPFQKPQANKKNSNEQQKLQKRCSFELLECCSHCKRSNFKALVLQTGILCTSNPVCCMGLWVRCVSVHLYNSRGSADNVSVKIKNSFSQIFLSREDLRN